MKYRHLNKWIKQLPTPAKALVIIGLIILTIVFGEPAIDKIEQLFNNSNIQLETVTLKRVVDGDTIIVTNQAGSDLRVRRIGIDTPESVHPDANKNTAEGQLASDYTKEQLKKNQTLYLEYDEELHDQYGRTLAYVWLTNNVDSNDIEDISNYMYNAKLIIDGYAVAKKFPPNIKYAEIFKQLETK